jgi:hypothetical protein
MSDMRKLLESIDKFAGEPEQKPGDQVRGTDTPKKSGKKHGFHGRLVGEGLDEFAQELLNEYRMFVEEPLNTAVAGNAVSPVANINPAGQGTAVTNPTMQANSTAQTTATGQANAQQAVGQNQGQPQTQQQGQQAAQNQQAQQGQQPGVQDAAMAMKAKQDLTQNISSLKSLDPSINVPKVVNALQKDPAQLSAIDAQALGQMSNTLEPILQNKAAASSMKSAVQRLTK